MVSRYLGREESYIDSPSLSLRQDEGDMFTRQTEDVKVLDDSGTKPTREHPKHPRLSLVRIKETEIAALFRTRQ